MSWIDVVGGISPVAFSAVEASRFGVSMARMTIGSNWRAESGTSENLYRSVAAALSEASERIVVLRFPSELVRMSTAVTSAGRSVIPAGTLMYWSLDIHRYVKPETPPGLIARGALIDEDEAGLLAALEDSFTGYSNHYGANPLLDAELVTAGYREWAESTLRNAAGSAQVLERDGAIIGIATVRLFESHPGVCEIELAGIINRAQGQGSYQHLLAAVVDGARQAGCDEVVISTQSHNIRVQRAWASAGFRPVASIETNHCVVGER